ncbi:hypothetical protein N7455_004241 [Penicillium solitum]|uniref:uncharacterized protein n=1 Tax=Penicillium solitum TaxID=60172 RepID=UPI0032C49D86|nr:hypothetical protein N7455_004241 [Penicillium solitum]
MAFYAAAIANGGICNGKPGLREHYGQSYFAAFVIDPDGWRLEAENSLGLKLSGYFGESRNFDEMGG